MQVNDHRGDIVPGTAVQGRLSQAAGGALGAGGAVQVVGLGLSKGAQRHAGRLLVAEHVPQAVGGQD